VLELACRLSASEFDELADRLEDAWRREVKVFALEVDERDAILRVLEDGPAEFGELRTVLLQEHVWRQRSDRCGRASGGVASPSGLLR
jgi:hypothetical protein